MDKFVIKNIIVFNLSMGLLMGMLAAIPFLGLVMLFGLLILCAPITIVLSIMNGNEYFAETKESIIGGAICGFCSNITFSVAYAIILAIMSYGFHYTPNLILSSMILNSPIWLFIVFIMFIGVLTATTNAFTGFGTACIINFIRDMYEKKQNSKKFKDFIE